MKSDYKIITIGNQEKENDETLDFLIRQAAINAEKLNDQPHLVNVEVFKNLMCVYEIVKYLAKDIGCTVEYDIGSTFGSVGSVSAVLSSLQIDNVALFSKACQLSSNFNIYPRTDGKLRIDFSFNGIAKAVK